MGGHSADCDHGRGGYRRGSVAGSRPRTAHRLSLIHIYTGPAIVILAPILLPAVQALGVDSVHFGVILVCCLSIGLATPPFGLDLFVAGNLAEEPPMAVAKRAVPFIISFLLALALITYVEPVSLALLGR